MYDPDFIEQIFKEVPGKIDRYSLDAGFGQHTTKEETLADMRSTKELSEYR